MLVRRASHTKDSIGYSSGEGYALCNMHYALIFSGTSVVPTSKLCIMRNMHYENMRYEIFDCNSLSMFHQSFLDHASRHIKKLNLERPKMVHGERKFIFKFGIKNQENQSL